MYPQLLGTTNNKENNRQLQRFERQLGAWARLLDEAHLQLKIKTRRAGCLPNVQEKNRIKENKETRECILNKRTRDVSRNLS